MAASIVGVATPSFGVAVGENYMIPLDGKPVQMGSVVMGSVKIPVEKIVAIVVQTGVLHSAPTSISPRVGTGLSIGITKDFGVSTGIGYQYNPNNTHSVSVLVTPSVAIAQNTRLNITTGVTHNFSVNNQAVVISPTISFQF